MWRRQYHYNIIMYLQSYI